MIRSIFWNELVLFFYPNSFWIYRHDSNSPNKTISFFFLIIRFIQTKDKKMKDHVLSFVVLLSLSVLVSQTIGGRVKAPFLQQSNTNGLTFSKSFNSIYDTSMYGRLQLNNGLARTPQMGYVQ